MNSRRRFQSIFLALLFVALSTGMVLAQQDDQSAYPAPNAPQQYPDQGGQQPYPGQGQPQASYPQQPQAQQYPQGQQPGYPNQQQGDQAYNGQPQQDPPGRVARVQYMSGQVSMQPGGINDWIAASANRPLTSADRVWTDKNSRAELNVGDGFLRMNAETSVTLTNVSDNSVQIELDQGTLEVTVRHLEKGEIYEIDTPNYAFTVMKSGTYRFDVYPNEDQSWVTVRSGYGEATGNGPAVRVNSGQMVRFSNGTSLAHTTEGAPARDGFDDWAQVRDKRLDDSLSARYVSPGVIGYQDLDGYGNWTSTPNYGNVWVPNSVPTGWAPYRYGHWAWIAPWGWTWVDDQPWGFAPFHYGRWVSWNGGWGWAPGPLGYWNPYYAPALVGWIGGPGFGVGFGWGGFGIGINFGWFPLGWGEPFYPRYCGWGHGGWYRGGGWVSNNYVRNVNVSNTHITNINNITNNYYRGNTANARYGFRNQPGAVTAAPRSAFTSGAAINRVGGAVPSSALGKGNVMRGVDATPTRQSVIGGAAQAHNVPPSSAFNRNVVTANHGGAVNRPANIEAANQATMAHGNMNAVHGNAGASNVAGAPNNNAMRPPVNGTTQNGRVNTPNGAMQNGHINTPNAQVQNGRVNASPTNPQAANGVRGPAVNGSEARVETPNGTGGHYVPRPPSAGGNPTPHSNVNGVSAAPGSNGNAANPNYAGGRAPAVNGNQTHTAAENPNQVSQPHYGATNPNQASQPHSGAVSQNPATYQPRAGASPNQTPTTYQPGRVNTTPQYSTPSRPATSAPAPHPSAPAASAPKSSGGSQGNGSHSGPGAALSVPRPPTGYSGNSAPTYSASSNYGAANRGNGNTSFGNANGNASRGYSASPNFNAGRSYGSVPTSSPQRTAPSYSPQRTYTSAPVASNRSYSSAPVYSPRSSAPSYSSRSMSSTPSRSYSAPRSSGGGGGGGAHVSSGGGGHSGSGGHR